MTGFTHAFLLVYAGLFPIVNPIGSAPDFPWPHRWLLESGTQ